MLAVSSEAFFTGIAIVLLVGAILAGRWLAGRVATAPRSPGSLVTALALGALGGRVVDVVLAALLWGALILATILAATRLRGVAAIAAGAIGGMIAVQAAVVVRRRRLQRPGGSARVRVVVVAGDDRAGQGPRWAGRHR
jgi:hypothetical protein